MVVATAVAAAVTLAGAPRAATGDPGALTPALELDLGLAVVGAGYSHPVAERLALMAEAQVFSTYFLPWADAGDRVDGFGGQLRLTWFGCECGRGLYVTPYLRVDRVTAEGAPGSGVGFTVGAAGGWVFGFGDRVDLRVGAGAQYLRYRVAPAEVATPFVQLDLVVAYRL